MRRINTLLRGVSHKTHGSDTATTPPIPNTYSSLLHVVDMFGFENSEVLS